MRFSKKIVVSIVILNVLFTIAVLLAFVKVKTEPAVLIGSWFGFTTVELWQCARVSISKNKKTRKEKKDDTENNCN